MIRPGNLRRGVLVGLACLCAPASAADPQTGAYLGQQPPGMTPAVFAPEVVSTEAYEVAGTFTPDGREYYFTRRPDAEGRDNRLLVTRLVDGVWSTPAPPEFATDCVEHEPHVDPTGELLFFHSSRARPAGAPGPGTIWFSRRTDEGWSPARYLGGSIAAGQAMYVTSTENGDLYFCGAFGRDYGIFRSRRTQDGYGPTEYLPPEVNGNLPSHPFITPDESVLLFDAYTAGPARPELYVCFRRGDGSWTKAAKLGPEINATGTEYAPSLSPDGRVLFFHRKMRGNGDIWWVDARVLDVYRP